MADTTMKLSNAMQTALRACTADKDRLAFPHPKAPAPTRAKMAKALLDAGLVEPIGLASYPAAANWMLDGRNAFFHVTDAGLRAIGIEPPRAAEEDTRPRHEQNGIDESQIYEDAPAATLKPAAADSGSRTFLVTFSCIMAPDTGDRIAAMLRTFDKTSIALALRSVTLYSKTAKAARPPRIPKPAGAPRAGSKQEAIVALLRRPEGASGPAIQEATGWAPHTVRGFLAGLGHKGITVTVLERVRQVGPNKAGAKGSYSIYRAERSA